MTTATEMKAKLLTKAAEDGEFRAHLLADPKAAISSETGVTVPEGFHVAVHEDSRTTAHLVLPSSPDLSEIELKQAVGGGSTGQTMYQGLGW